MLSVQDVAAHYGFRPDTVCARIRSGDLPALTINRSYRSQWPDVWACEEGPMPRPQQAERYHVPLLANEDLAGRLRVSVRTVDRWIAERPPYAERLRPRSHQSARRRRLASALPEKPSCLRGGGNNSSAGAARHIGLFDTSGVPATFARTPPNMHRRHVRGRLCETGSIPRQDLRNHANRPSSLSLHCGPRAAFPVKAPRLTASESES